MQICNRTKFPNNIWGGMSSHRAVENHFFIFNHVVIFLDPDHRWHWKLAFHYMNISHKKIFCIPMMLNLSSAEMVWPPSFFLLSLHKYWYSASSMANFMIVRLLGLTLNLSLSKFSVICSSSPPDGFARALQEIEAH